MKNIFYLMAMAIVTLTFSACTNDENFLAEVNYPQEAAGDKMVVDAWANNFPLEIKSEGEWRIESSDFITVKPTEGKGNAIVKVYVEDNEEEQRLKGNVTIVFPGHKGQNKVLAVEQKWTGEYDENADVLGTSNKIYAVGYGYNTMMGLLANKNCLKSQIFKTGQLIEEEVEVTDGLDMHAVVSTVTGNSISDLSNKLTVKAGGSGGFGKFKAEANASFTMDYTDNSNHEYAINYLEATLTTASFDLPIEDLRTEEYMTEKAYNAINGLNENYPSTKAGLSALIRAYGTHVVMRARLGGRVRQSLDVDITNITESYDLNVFAKASYEGVFAKAEGSVDDDFHKSFNENKESTKINVEAMGGDTKLAKALVAPDGFTEANYMAWFNSVDGTNLALMGFDDDSLLPLWELVDKTKFPKRYEDLYNFMNGKEIEEVAETFEDNSTYDSGTVTEFDIPTFSTDYNATLVKDIKLGGQIVGQVCEEYIPAINHDKRVIVIYPVIGTTVRYNMGFFIGDDTHKPARVAWNGTETNIIEYADLDFGQVNKLYLRGASITAAPVEGAEVKQGTLENEFLQGLHYNTYAGSNQTYNYPLVKIFDKIWTRMNYNQREYGNSGSFCLTSMGGKQGAFWNEFYTVLSVKSTNFPKGWHVAKKADYTNMHNKLVANGFALPGLALQNGNVTGFEMYYVGYFTNNDEHEENGVAGLVTSDLCYFGYLKNGSIEGGWEFTTNKHNIRLVKD
jgi:hypothetical protein